MNTGIFKGIAAQGKVASRSIGIRAASALVACTLSFPALAEVVTVGIGTQNTTTNTVTGGVVLKELGLIEKHLAKVQAATALCS